MESFITPEDVVNVILFVIPGYFALKTYSIVYTKRDREFSFTLLESIAYSLPIVSLYSLIWEHFAGVPPNASSVRYTGLLLVVSIVAGWLWAWFRRRRLIRTWAQRLRLPGAPDEDFIRAQFSKLGKTEFITVALKNGEVFSGTPQTGSILRDGAPRQYSFNDVIWYDKAKKSWEQSEGSIIIDLDEVLYFLTEQPLPRD